MGYREQEPEEKVRFWPMLRHTLSCGALGIGLFIRSVRTDSEFWQGAAALALTFAYFGFKRLMECFQHRPAERESAAAEWKLPPSAAGEGERNGQRRFGPAEKGPALPGPLSLTELLEDNLEPEQPPEAESVRRCPYCRGLLTAGLPFCIGCSRPLPEREKEGSR